MIADLGLSTAVDRLEDATYTESAIKSRYTLRFAAPELLDDTIPGASTRSKTRESDVYAFGLLIIQVCAHISNPDNSDVLSAIHRKKSLGGSE